MKTSIVDYFREHLWTNLVATGATISPLWYDTLKGVSSISATLLPIFGLTWIIVQMIAFFRKDRKD